VANTEEQKINMPIPVDLVDRSLALAQRLSSLPMTGEVPENAEELAEIDVKELEKEIKSLTTGLTKFSAEELSELNTVLASRGRKPYEDAKKKLYVKKQSDVLDKILLLEQVKEARGALHQGLKRPAISRTKVMVRALEIGLTAMESGEVSFNA
jgi:PBP1b-binding outer membrane lipoprotein LpoB